MNYKKMMFDLFQKGQKIYEEYALIDYMKEFEEFKADKILYEKRSNREFAMLGRYEFFFPLYDKRYRHQNHALTMTPPEDSDYFAYYFKDGELRYVLLMKKKDVPSDFYVKVIGNTEVVLYRSSDPEKKIFAIRIREDGDGKVFYTKIYGWHAGSHEVEYTIDYQDGRQDVFTLSSSIMYRNRYVYSEDEKWYVLKKIDCKYHRMWDFDGLVESVLNPDSEETDAEKDSKKVAITIDDFMTESAICDEMDRMIKDEIDDDESNHEKK